MTAADLNEKGDETPQTPNNDVVTAPEMPEEESPWDAYKVTMTLFWRVPQVVVSITNTINSENLPLCWTHRVYDARRRHCRSHCLWSRYRTSKLDLWKIHHSHHRLCV